MAYLNAKEREDLAQRLSQMTFQQIRGHVNRLDKSTRLRFYRSNQHVDRWETSYDLPSLGTRVTLIEARDSKPQGLFARLKYRIQEIVVEPSPENKT